MHSRRRGTITPCEGEGRGPARARRVVSACGPEGPGEGGAASGRVERLNRLRRLSPYFSVVKTQYSQLFAGAG